jgi:hypothetical protein
MDPLALLSALAQIAASLVGFSGLRGDMNSIRTLLILSVSALVFALLPLPLIASQSPGWWWKVLTVVIAANLLFWSVQSPRWMKRTGLRPRRPALYRVMISTQALLAVLLIGGALVVVDARPLYSVGVLWFLMAAVVVFVVQVFALLAVAPVDNEQVAPVERTDRKK